MLQNILKYSTLLALISINNNCWSETKLKLKNYNQCQPAKTSLNPNQPKIFNHTNNLIKPTGGLNFYEGKEIIIEGRLLDKNCTPISDATVYLWQADENGRYIHKSIHNKKQYFDIEGFQGSGSCITNNLGQFKFISIYPGAVRHEMAHIDIKVKAAKTGHLQTKIYLKPMLRDTNEDINLIQNNAKLDKVKCALGYQIVEPSNNIYKFDITMATENKFRRY